jgi:hypothetical protein
MAAWTIFETRRFFRCERPGQSEAIACERTEPPPVHTPS